MRCDGPLHYAASESVVRFFLMNQYPPQPLEWGVPFHQPLLDAIENGLAQPFQNDLLGQHRFQELPLAERFLQHPPILFQRR